MKDQLEDLAQLTDALYQAELGKMRALNARETNLRRDLATLEDHRRNSRSLPDSHWQGVRQIGADILWQGWVGRTREDLNIQLAQVLAQKEHLIAKLRKAFGKKTAAAEMLNLSQSEAGRRRKKQRALAQDGLQIMKSHRG